MSGHKEHKQHAFDAYCKRILRNEVVDASREDARHRKREKNFSDLSAKELAQLIGYDHYAPERRVFSVQGLGIDIEVEDGELVAALAALPEALRNVVLLAYLVGLNDPEIAAVLELTRSTVQYRRTAALQQMRKTMEEYDHE